MVDRVVVVIPQWNRKELLQHCLRSLQRQTFRSFRIVVVDNASQDGSPAMVRSEFPEVELFCLDHNTGFARAVNHGIRHSRQPYVAVLNNDTETDPGWLQAAVSALDRLPLAGFCASRIMDFCQRDRIDSAGDCISRTGLPYKMGLGETAVGKWLASRLVFGASAGAALYRRSLLEETGGFDEDFFMYLEDVDLSFRAQLLGYSCIYEPRAVVYHIEAASDPERPPAGDKRGLYTDRRVFWITRNRLLVLAQNMPAPILLANLPWIAYGFSRSFLFHLLKAGFAGAYLRGFLAGLRSVPSALRKRRIVQSRRRCKISYLKNLFRQC